MKIKLPLALTPKNLPEPASNGLRIPFLRSKMMEYDGQVTREEVRLFNRLWFGREVWKGWANSLCMCAWITLPFGLTSAGWTVANYIHYYGLISLVHPDFFLALAGDSVLTLFFTAYIAFIHELLTISPHIVYPEAVYISNEGFAFDKHNRRIPWQNVMLVQKRSMLLGRRRRAEVLEIYVGAQPYEKALNPLQRFSEHFSTLGLKKSRFLFDPATHKFADNPYEGICFRVPVDLFGFEADREKFVKALKANIAPEALPEELELSSAPSSGHSFTTLWLDELRLSKNTDTRRLLDIGHRLNNGRYEVKSVLGYGGFSVVYEAASGVPADITTSDAQQEKVAIKELIINSGGSRTSKETLLKQIVAEIDLLKTLDHPNIVKCLDYFTDSGRVYIVMQAIEGKNLRDFVAQNGPLAQNDLIEIGRQCCSILTYLHERSKPIIHRDFTPDNLIWDGQTVKLIDFNVAEETNTNSSPTIVGKHSYLAPEQWCGSFTEKGDLYQLGCSLYFLATGQDPEAISQSDPAVLHPQLSASFCAIVRTLTETDPLKRYATARETGLHFQPAREPEQ